MERTVVVWGKACLVTVYQKSKSVWVAAGEYMGESKSCQDRSANAAVMRWQEWAKFKGN